MTDELPEIVYERPRSRIEYKEDSEAKVISTKTMRNAESTQSLQHITA